MEIFDPFLIFRWFPALFFIGWLIDDLIDIAIWYRATPRFTRRWILLKLLRFRSRPFRTELAMIALLIIIQGGLALLFFNGG